jgi:hypothetical protein
MSKRKVIKRAVQKITSWYGWRKGFKFFHYGVDLRSWNDAKKRKLPAVLPEPCKFIRSKYQKKWGWTHVFKGLETGYILKFTHIEERNFVDGWEYPEGFAVGKTIVTEYMVKKKLYDHLHFSTWGMKGLKPFNPVIYFKEIGIDYE